MKVNNGPKKKSSGLGFHHNELLALVTSSFRSTQAVSRGTAQPEDEEVDTIPVPE